jgi:hypothetical protein
VNPPLCGLGEPDQPRTTFVVRARGDALLRTFRTHQCWSRAFNPLEFPGDSPPIPLDGHDSGLASAIAAPGPLPECPRLTGDAAADDSDGTDRSREERQSVAKLSRRGEAGGAKVAGP